MGEEECLYDDQPYSKYLLRQTLAFVNGYKQECWSSWTTAASNRSQYHIKSVLLLTWASITFGLKHWEYIP